MSAHMKRYLPYAIIVTVFLLTTALAVENYKSSTTPAPRSGKLAFGKPGADPPHIRGNRKAPVALEKFGDFECKPCSLLYPILKTVEAEYGEKLSVTFREYPLTKHTHALDAARAAEAAGLQGKFWEMHDALYENRLVWLNATDTRAALTGYAEKLGLDMARFQKDMDGDDVSRRIADDHDRVMSLELDRTPSVFVNGDPVTTRPITIEVLRAAIDGALGNQK
ncbi:MAG: DsbA family protein [Chthoniobacterales bacterium]